jgi:hypothetical protein
MVVWMVQAINQEIRVVNHIEKEDSDIPWFVNECNAFAVRHHATLGMHYAPWDIRWRDPFTKKTRQQTAEEMGIKFYAVEKTKDLNESIEQTRRLFARCSFHSEFCARGLGNLASYYREYNEKLKRYDDLPVHNFASNTADAFRQMAQAWKDELGLVRKTGENAQAGQMSADFSLF